MMWKIPEWEVVGISVVEEGVAFRITHPPSEAVLAIRQFFQKQILDRHVHELVRAVEHKLMKVSLCKYGLKDKVL